MPLSTRHCIANQLLSPISTGAVIFDGPVGVCIVWKSQSVTIVPHPARQCRPKVTDSKQTIFTPSVAQKFSPSVSVAPLPTDIAQLPPKNVFLPPPRLENNFTPVLVSESAGWVYRYHRKAKADHAGAHGSLYLNLSIETCKFRFVKEYRQFDCLTQGQLPQVETNAPRQPYNDFKQIPQLCHIPFIIK